jgi:hypothetical protein
LLGGFRALVPSLSWQIESSLFAHPCSAETQNQPRLSVSQGCKVNAFLLVPGWTITMIATKGDQRLQGEAWDPSKAQDERSYDGVQDP